MKEAEQYLIYDGLLDVSEDVSMDTSAPSTTSVVEEDNVTVSEENSSEEFSTTPQDSSLSAKKSHNMGRATPKSRCVLKWWFDNTNKCTKLYKQRKIMDKPIKI